MKGGNYGGTKSYPEICEKDIVSLNKKLNKSEDGFDFGDKIYVLNKRSFWGELTYENICFIWWK